MGQTQSHPNKHVVIHEYDPVKYSGDWWFIGKTGPIHWDQDSDEYKQSLTWNAKTQKMESFNCGYNGDHMVQYTHSHLQFWSTRQHTKCDVPAGMMTVHRNGCAKTHMACIMWTDYVNFAVFYSDIMKCCYLLSRHRKIHPDDQELICKIFCDIGINPAVVNINKPSISEHAKQFLSYETILKSCVEYKWTTL